MFFQILLIVSLVDLIRNLPGLPPAVNDLARAFNVLSSVFLTVTWSLASVVVGVGLFLWYSISQCLSILASCFSNKRSAFHALVFLSTFALSASSSVHLVWMSNMAEWAIYSLTSFAGRQTYLSARVYDLLVSLLASSEVASVTLSMYQTSLYAPLSSFANNIYATVTMMARTLLAQLSYIATTLALSSYAYFHFSYKAFNIQNRSSNKNYSDALSCVVPHASEGAAISDESAPFLDNNDFDTIVPADILVAAVDHLVETNHQLAVHYKAALQEKNTLSTHVEHLLEVQLDFSHQVDDLQAEVNNLTQQLSLLSSENARLQLLNNTISSDASQLAWTNTLLSQEVDTLKAENDALTCKSARLDQECETLDEECTRLDERFDHFREIMQEVIKVKNREYSDISADLVFVESDLKKCTESPVFQTPISPCFCPCPTHNSANANANCSSPPNTLFAPADKAGNTSSSYFLSSLSGGESTLNNSSSASSPPGSPSPFAPKAIKAAKQFTSLFETIIPTLSPYESSEHTHSLEDVFNGNGNGNGLGLGFTITPPKARPGIDAVLAFAGASPSSSSEEEGEEEEEENEDVEDEFSPERGFRTSTPPPKYQLKKRAARLALRQEIEIPPL